MFQRGDIVEHASGRWKGRRLTVTGIDRFGCVDVIDDKGKPSSILRATTLRIIRQLPTRAQNMDSTLDAIIEHREFSYWPFALQRHVERMTMITRRNIMCINAALDGICSQLDSF